LSKLNNDLLYFAPCGMHDGIGGGGRLKNMIDIFKDLELNVQLISYSPGDYFKIKNEQINPFLKSTTINVPMGLPKLLKAFIIPLIILHGLNYISRSRIVFALTPSVASGFPATVLAKIFNKPLFVDHMDVRDPETPEFLYNNTLKNSTLTLVISHFLENEVKNKFQGNTFYLPIFIDTDVFQKNGNDRRKVREKLGIKESEIVIGYAGSFWYVEGVPVLLESFRNLVKKHKNIRLILLGGGRAPNLDTISISEDEIELNEKVIFIPPQPYEQVPKFLSACDIVCSPKVDCEVNRAANPIKTYEYMSMGLITVISSVGEVANVIKNGVNGFLVNPGDEKDLENTLDFIIQNMGSMGEIGRQARKDVIKNYSQSATFKKMKNIFQQDFINSIS